MINNKKVITTIYSLLVLLTFSYYYYYHGYFKMLLDLTIASFILILLFFIFKKIAKRFIDYKKIKEILHKGYYFSLSKLIIIFLVLILLILNLFTFFNREIIYKVIPINIISIEINIIFQITTILLFDLIFIFVLWSIGSKIIKLLKLSSLSAIEKFIFGFGFGAVPLMFLTFTLAVLGLLYSKFILLILIVCLLFSYKEIIENFKKINKLHFTLPSSKNFSDVNFYKKLVVVVLFIAITFLFISTIQPLPIDYDALHTYYNTPQNFFRAT